MDSVEITAKSVDEARKAAAEKLGVEPSRLQVTVLEETKGLFGRSNVRIRAEAIAEAPVAAAVAPVALPASEDKKPRGGRRGATSKKPAATEEAAAPEPAKAAEPAQENLNGEEPTERVEIVATQEDGERLVQLVRDLLGTANLQVTVTLGGISGRYVNVILDGKDVAFLVGKHGEVLNALQYLVNIIAGRKLESGVRATLDGNDYRRRREEALTKLARKIAEQVQERGEEAVLDALPAFERRIVHKAISEVSGVTTYSEGEEPNRRVVIAPAE